MRVRWSDVGDPREFACAVLLRESPDIDPETMRRSVWTVERLTIMGVTEALVVRQCAQMRR
ncbi:MAG: hypothetical protein ACR2NO_04355 [Chloroflexota bacterium]